MRIEVRPAAAVGIGILLALDPAALFLPFLLAAALHEAGHLLALRLCGTSVTRLQIGLTGAVMHTAPMDRRREAAAAAAGPAVNLLLSALFFRGDPIFSLLNLLLAVYNLIPVYPLDGGRLLLALLPAAAEPVGTAALLLLTALGAAACAVWRLGLWPVLLLGVLLAKLSYLRGQM